MYDIAVPEAVRSAVFRPPIRILMYCEATLAAHKVAVRPWAVTLTAGALRCQGGSGIGEADNESRVPTKMAGEFPQR